MFPLLSALCSGSQRVSPRAGVESSRRARAPSIETIVASITAQYVERAPKAAELFSRGAHDATATFDIGNPNLTIESAKSVEIGLRKATGPFRFEATAYYTRFDNFIYRRLTGVMCGSYHDVWMELHEDLILTQGIDRVSEGSF